MTELQRQTGQKQMLPDLQSRGHKNKKYNVFSFYNLETPMFKYPKTLITMKMRQS